VTNFGISQKEVDRQFAFDREFYGLPLEQRLKFYNAADLARGEYNGYRPAGQREYVYLSQKNGIRKADVENRLMDGIFDNIQVYNIPKFDGFHKRAQPKVLQNNIGEIEKFSRVSFLIGHGYRTVF
jgi:hypothetical protein